MYFYKVCIFFIYYYYSIISSSSPDISLFYSVIIYKKKKKKQCNISEFNLYIYISLCILFVRFSKSSNDKIQHHSDMNAFDFTTFENLCSIKFTFSTEIHTIEAKK